MMQPNVDDLIPGYWENSQWQSVDQVVIKPLATLCGQPIYIAIHTSQGMAANLEFLDVIWRKLYFEQSSKKGNLN